MKSSQKRMENVERWANFVANNEDKVWYELQAELIDSQIENAEQIGLTKEQIKYIKEK